MGGIYTPLIRIKNYTLYRSAHYTEYIYLVNEKWGVSAKNRVITQFEHN